MIKPRARLQADYHRAHYANAAASLHRCLGQPDPEAASIAVNQAREQVLAVAETVTWLDHRPRRRRYRELWRFLTESMEPSSVLLLAGAILIAPEQEPMPKDVSYVPGKGHVKDRRTLIARCTAPMEGFTTHDLVTYARADTSVIHRVRYNAACYWSTELAAFRNSPFEQARADRALAALERSMWLARAPAALRQWAWRDPSLTALRKHYEADFRAAVGGRPTARVKGTTAGTQEKELTPDEILDRVPRRRAVEFIDLAHAVPQLSLLDALHELERDGELRVEGDRIERASGADR
jgi:hypothetical protein